MTSTTRRQSGEISVSRDSNVVQKQLELNLGQSPIDAGATSRANVNTGGQDVDLEATPMSRFVADDYPTGLKLWVTVIAVASVLILGALDINIVATAVPSMVDEFHTIADVGWYSSAFRLTTCAFQFMYGRLYKFFPVKRVFMASNALFLVSSVLCATAPNSTIFILGRAVSGLGFAGILSGLYAFQTFPPHQRPLYVGVMCGIESIAIASAPIIGGALTQSRGWRWCFWMNLPIAGATLLIMAFLPDPTKATEDHNLSISQKLLRLDLLSNVLLIPALSCLFVALSWAGVKYSWKDGRVIGLLVTFAILSIAFVYNQYRRGDSATLPLRILQNRNIIAGLVFTTCVNSVLNVLQYYLPTYYQIVRGYSPAKSGYLMIPITIGDSVGAILHGLGTTLWGYYTPPMLLASICMPIFAGLITTFDTTTTFAKLILVSAAAGFSTGVGYMGPQNAALTTLDKEDAPLGISVILFGTNFGPAIFVAIAQVIFTNRLSASLKHAVSGANGFEIEVGGWSHIVNSLPKSQREAVVTEISKSLSQTWYLAVALGATTMIGSLLMEWKSVKEKRE